MSHRSILWDPDIRGLVACVYPPAFFPGDAALEWLARPQPEGVAVSWLRRIFSGPQRGAERRRYPRYPVATSLEVDAAGHTFSCTLDNLSAGGVRLTPGIEVELGTTVTVRHSGSGMSLAGRVVGHDEGGTRVQFDSEDAGIIVSSWLRMVQQHSPGGR